MAGDVLAGAQAARPAASHDRPFAGVRVCDVAQGIAGPHAAMLLAQYGADVIKIEGLDGDWVRNMGGRIAGDQSAQSLTNNRGKRSVALDLKNPKAAEIARRIAARSDVFTQSFRPGVIERLGLGYETIRALRPDVVYLTVSGFGQEGPLARKPATDAILQGFSGLQSITRDGNDVPQRVGMAIIDFLTGLYAFQAVATALYARAAGAGGRLVDVSLMGSAIAVQAGQFIRHHVQGGQPPANGIPVGTFRTTDGWLNLAANRPDSFGKVCDALGLDALKNRPDLDTHQKRVWKSAEINAALAVPLATRSTADWIAFFEKLDILCTRVNEYGDVLADEHVKAVGTFTWIDQPGVGTIPVPNPPGPATLAPDDPRGPSPSVGQHTREVLREIGLGDGDIDGLAAEGAVALG